MSEGSGASWLGGVFDLLKQQKDIAYKSRQDMSAALKDDRKSSSQPVSRSTGAADKLMEMFGQSYESPNYSETELGRLMKQNQEEADKLDSYGGDSFGNSSMPKKNYGLNLGNQYKSLGE